MGLCTSETIRSESYISGKVPKHEVRCWISLSLWFHLIFPVSALGPGSRNLIPKLDERVNGILTKGPRHLTLDEWKVVVQEFKNWPFRPEVYYILKHTDHTLYSLSGYRD